MERQRKTKMIVIISLLVAVVGLSVAYAAMTGVLTINGSANVDAATWNIHFDNLEEAQISGEAKENSKPSINEDDKVRIDGINVTLNNPKDKVVYNVDLVNEGSIDAEISNIVVPTLTEEQEKYLEFKVTYTNDGTELAIGDLLNKGETKPLTITIRYKDEIDPSDLPKDKQTISLSYELTFTQSDGENTGTTTPGEDEKEMFVWESDTIISGLTEYGIEQVKADGGHLEIPEGVTEIAGTSLEEAQETGILTTGFSPIAIGKINMNDSNQSIEDVMANSEINIIKSVSFPSTLKKIGDMAFYGCNNLTGELNLPEGLEEIGDYVFDTTGITGELIIPDSVVTIGVSAFSHTQITTLTLGSSVETIGDSAFFRTQISGELYIPDSVLTVERSAFTGTNITSVSISKNTQYVSGYDSSFPITPTIRD